MPVYSWRIIRNRNLKPEELGRLQNKKLRALVKHSFEHVPLYHACFKEAGISPDDIKSVDDLVKIPVLSKDLIRNLPVSEKTADNIDLDDCLKVTTSGTTGTPLTAFRDKNEKLFTVLHSYIWQMRCGDKPSNRRIVLVGWQTSPPRYVQRLGFFRTKHLPTFLPPEEQINVMRKYDPRTVITVPSSMVAIGKEMEDHESKGLDIRLIFSGGEMLTESARNFMEEIFKAEVFESYGANEVGAIARECTEHTGLHVDSDSIIVEVTKDGERVSEGEEGDVTVTNFNYSMPLIRYNMGDIGVIFEDECPCGCAFPLMKVTGGRKSHMIHLPDGKRISAVEIFYEIGFKEGVKKYQVRQEKIDFISAKIVPNNKFSEGTKVEIENMLKKRLPQMNIEVTVMDDIPRGESRKNIPFIPLKIV